MSRVLADAVNDARMAQLSAERLSAAVTGQASRNPLVTLDEAGVIGDPNPPRIP